MSFEFADVESKAEKSREASRSFDPDKTVDSVRTDGISEDRSFDPDKPIDSPDVDKGGYDKCGNESNVENNKQEISATVSEYISDLRSKSDFPDTISESVIDISKIEVKSPEAVAEKREEFDDNKSNLRKEWEELHHKEWPKYTEDVINENGKVIRRAGDNYDAHHIQPLQLGGENSANNITPLDVFSHKEVHSSTGSCNALVARVKGDK